MVYSRLFRFRGIERDVGWRRLLVIVQMKTMSEYLDLPTLKYLVNPFLKVINRIGYWWYSCGPKDKQLRWIARTEGAPVLIYIHGGGMCVDMPPTNIKYLHLIDQEVSPLSIASLEYTLCSSFPVPVEEAWRAYETEVTKGNIVYLMGDSVGGALCLNILQRCYSHNVKFPEKCVAISPWLNITKPEIHLKDGHPLDYMTWGLLALFKNIYAPRSNPNDPSLNIESNFHPEVWSSILQDTQLLITCGEQEILRPQIVRFFSKLHQINHNNVQLLEETLGVHVSTLLFDPWTYPKRAETMKEIMHFLQKDEKIDKADINL